MDTQDNTRPHSIGARAPLSIIDALDLLTEARELNQALFMAIAGMGTNQHSAALQRLSALTADRMLDVARILESVQAEAAL